MQAVLFV